VQDKPELTAREKVVYVQKILALKNPTAPELAVTKGFLTDAFEKRPKRKPNKQMRNLATKIIEGVTLNGTFSYEIKARIDIPERDQLDQVWAFLLPFQYAWSPFDIYVTEVAITGFTNAKKIGNKIKVTFSYEGEFQTKEGTL
jgi:hypothetical protein